MLDALVRGIRATGLEVSAQELQDILWLAEHLPAAEGVHGTGGAVPSQSGEPTSSQAKKDDGKASSRDDEASRIDRDGASAAGQGTASTSVYARNIAGALTASTLRVPGVASTDFPEGLRHALQPFARRVPSRWRKAVDEEATAEYAAEVGVWCPVYEPVRERWFDLRLVVEDSPSMALWSDTLAEFVRLLRNQGGFKSVTLYRWSDSKGKEVSTPDGRRLLAVDRLARRDRPLLVLLVSDGTSVRWRSGAARALLNSLGRHACVSVLQMLPQRAWRHCAVGEPELEVYGERAGEANVDLKALLPWWLDEREFRQGLGVPVVGLDAGTLKPWARTMTARGGASAPAVLVPRGEAQPDARQDGIGPVSAAEKVARYRGMVSREAYELAVFLSVPDPLTVPVMRLVQRTMLPSTGTAELAEFFVGGLLEPLQVDGDAGEAAYRLAPGVREELTKSLRYSEEGRINEQLRSVGRLLENAAGSERSFDAYFPAPGGSQRLTEWSMPFASLSKAVLRGGAFQEPASAQAKHETKAPPVRPQKRLVYMSFLHEDADAARAFGRVFLSLAGTRPEIGEADVYVDDAEARADPGPRERSREAIGRSSVLVFMASRRSIRSRWCMEEEVAVAHRLGVLIVPLLLEECDWDVEPIPGDPDRRRLNTYAAAPRSPNGRLRPLNQWNDRDEAMRSVVSDLLDAWATDPAGPEPGAERTSKARPPRRMRQVSMPEFDVTPWPTQSPLYRVLREGFPPNAPRPSMPSDMLRFEPADRNVPVLYAAGSVSAALTDVVLSLAGASRPRAIDETALRGRVCATLSPTRALSLVSLSKSQLVRLGFDPVEFDSSAHLRAELVTAIRDTRADIDGLRVPSRIESSAEIICLFGDRVRQDELLVTKVEPIAGMREQLADALSRLQVGLLAADRPKRIFISCPSDYAAYGVSLASVLERDLEVDGPTQAGPGEDWMNELEASIERADGFVAIVGPHSGRLSEEIRLAMRFGKRVIAVAAGDIEESAVLSGLPVANVDADGQVALLSRLQGTALARVIDSTAVNVLRAMGVDPAPLLLELRHTYDDLENRYFNPTRDIDRVGRRLEEGDFRALVSQLHSDELLIGLYENQAPALVATHVHSRARLLELSQAELRPLGFYAMDREIANRGWGRGTPVPARGPHSGEEAATIAARQAAQPVAADTRDGPNRPDSGWTTLEFETSAALTSEIRAHLQSAFLDFEAYLVRCGYRPRTNSLRVFVDPQLEDNVYYEPGRVVLGAPLATDTDAFFRECSHHALLSPSPDEELGEQQSAVESGLADYFACSFNNDPRFGEQSIHLLGKDPAMASKGAIRLLDNVRRYDDVHPNSGTHDIGEIWGGAFWEMRQELGSQVADGLLLEGWQATMAQKKRTRDFKRRFITTLVEAASRRDSSLAKAVAAIFSRRGFGRFKP